jgi:hypothetical protein
MGLLNRAHRRQRLTLDAIMQLQPTEQGRVSSCSFSFDIFDKQERRHLSSL